MNLHIRKSLQKGYNEIAGEADERLAFIELGNLRLGDGETYTQKAEAKEAALVILSGQCTVKAGVETFEAIGARRDVFSGAPYAVYVPCDMAYEIVGVGDVEIALCRAPSDLKCPVRLITPAEVKTKSVGRLNWRRDVRDILDTDIEAKHLVIGETLNPPGHWSSAPPHRHDFDRLPEEANMEEVYFFKLKPSQGFGIQRVYTDDRSTDEAYGIENNDAVAIPEGYHPVVAGPGYRLYYLWILAGEHRILCPRDDPAHAWLKNVEPIAEEIGL